MEELWRTPIALVITRVVGASSYLSYTQVKVNDVQGTGSHARRKTIMQNRLGDERVFEAIMGNFRGSFRDLSNDLQNNIDAVILRHLSDIRRTLDIIRTENAVTESEQDPAFRNHVAAKTATAKNNIRRIQAAIVR